MSNMTKMLRSVAGYLDNTDSDINVKQARINQILKAVISECEDLDLIPGSMFEHAYNDHRIDK